MKNPFEGMFVKLEMATDEKGYTRKYYVAFFNTERVVVDGKSEFRDDNEAVRAFLKFTKRKRP